MKTVYKLNDLFIKKHSSIIDKNLNLKKIKYYSAQRLAIRVLANIFIPVWFVLTNKQYSKGLCKNKLDRQLIVSLTTFPARISKIWIVVECMLRQSYPPDRIILWLSKDQFDGLTVLPKNLLKLQRRGLEIKFCEGDLRSHKKYFYVIKDNPNDTVITIDDDFIYPSNLIEKLIDLHSKYPKAICCHRALQIKYEGSKILPYKEWNNIFLNEVPSYDVFFTSGGGTLFPPNCFSKEVLNHVLFMKSCKYADDVWLNVMAQLNKTQTVKVPSSIENIMPIIIKDNIELTSVNVEQGLNDLQLKELLNFYKASQNLDWGLFNFEIN